MVALNVVVQTIGLLFLLVTEVTAFPAGSPTAQTEIVDWPSSAKMNRSFHKADTNAARIARGEPLKKPTQPEFIVTILRSKRLVGAPAQARASGSSRVFNFQRCIPGGFDFNDVTFLPESDATTLANACAGFADSKGATTFAVLKDGRCFTGPDRTDDQSCDDSNYAYYTR